MKFYGPTFSMIDYPGELGLTIFTKGCNFRCPICHNPALVLPTGEIESLFVDMEPLIGVIENKWITGVCITGGEPTIHRDLPDAIAFIRERAGVKIKLDTNGSNPDLLSEMIQKGLIDFVAMDVKAPLDNEKMIRASGIGDCGQLNLVKRGIEIVKSSGIDYHFRTVCFERFLSPEDIGSIAISLAPCAGFVLLAFDPHDTLDPEMRLERPSSATYMQKCLEEAKKVIPSAVLG